MKNKKTVTLKYHRQMMEVLDRCQESLRQEINHSQKLREALEEKNKDFCAMYSNYKFEAQEAFKARVDLRLARKQHEAALVKNIDLENSKFELEAAVKQLSRLLQENLAKMNFKINVVEADKEGKSALVPYKLPITA